MIQSGLQVTWCTTRYLGDKTLHLYKASCGCRWSGTESDKSPQVMPLESVSRLKTYTFEWRLVELKRCELTGARGSALALCDP